MLPLVLHLLLLLDEKLECFLLWYAVIGYAVGGVNKVHRLVIPLLYHLVEGQLTVNPILNQLTGELSLQELKQEPVSPVTLLLPHTICIVTFRILCILNTL